MKHLTNEQKRKLFRILIAAVLLPMPGLLSLTGISALLFSLIPYLIVGFPVLLEAGENILHGEIFDENFLMVLATAGAFGIGEYPEAVFVMLFFGIGELFEDIASEKSRQSVTALMDLRPDHAVTETPEGEKRLPPEEVKVGDILVVRPGERIPLDGTVLSGESSLNTAALTGESVPVSVGEGDTVISGCVNMTSLLRIRADKPYGESTAARILRLTEDAAEKKTKAEKAITAFARYYTPAVVIAALLLGLLPPLFLGGFSDWIARSLCFLVISCPCALVISVPLTYFAGIGAASRNGILVKGSDCLEQLAAVDTLLFDKTGTLTEGSFSVTSLSPVGISPDALLALAAYAEAYSDHPIALSLKEAYGGPIDKSRISGVTEYAGKGVSILLDGRRIYAGSPRFLAELGLPLPEADLSGTAVCLAEETKEGLAYRGSVLISDRIREGSADAVRELKKAGVSALLLLTGDSEETARYAAEQTGIPSFRAGLLPADKVAEAERLITGRKGGHPGRVAFIGDGINDAPVLTRADVGIAMGAMGTDAAMEAADIVIMDNDLRRLPRAMGIARRTGRIVKENIAFSLLVKLAVLALSAFGLCPVSVAVFADVGVMVLAVLNSLRAMRVPQPAS